MSMMQSIGKGQATEDLPQCHELPDYPFFLVCINAPSLVHAFLIGDRVAIYELAKRGGFRYQANVDLEEAIKFNLYAEAPKPVQQALKAGQSFTYALFPSGPKWYPSEIRPETNRTNLALESYREEYGKILLVTLQEAVQGDWQRIPDNFRAVVVPVIEGAVGRYYLAQTRYTQLH